MCLHNLTAGNICNGTKLKVIHVRAHIFECMVLTGKVSSTSVMIPRITLQDDSGFDTVRFQRKLFPVWLAYTCSIEKGQGQYLTQADVLYRTDCFHLDATQRDLRTSSSLRLGHSVRVQQWAWGARLFGTFPSSHIIWYSISYVVLYHHFSVIMLLYWPVCENSNAIFNLSFTSTRVEQWDFY